MFNVATRVFSMLLGKGLAEIGKCNQIDGLPTYRGRAERVLRAFRNKIAAGEASNSRARLQESKQQDAANNNDKKTLLRSGTRVSAASPDCPMDTPRIATSIEGFVISGKSLEAIGRRKFTPPAAAVSSCLQGPAEENSKGS